jgi:hypothetical protein
MSAPPEQHEMVHEGTDPSGAEAWRCPRCGRHFIVRWPPDYDRLVLEAGDESATHLGRKGEVSLRRMEATPASGDPPGAAEDAWRRWLRENGMDWDGWVA